MSHGELRRKKVHQKPTHCLSKLAHENSLVAQGYDLEEIRAYIAKENPGAAQSVAKNIIETVNLLEEHPHMGHPSDIDDVLEKQVVGLPYLFPYRVVGQYLQIMRVFHESQQ